MCHFITAVMCTDASLDAINEVGRSFGIAFDPAPGEQLVTPLLHGESYLLHRTGHCDCGTALGSRHRGTSSSASVERRVRKLRRNGWSESKIERWKADRLKGAASGGHPQRIQSWVEFIQAVTELPRSPRFGVLLHWYRGRIDLESFAFEREAVPLRSLTEELLLDMPEDRLVVFGAF